MTPKDVEKKQEAPQSTEAKSAESKETGKDTKSSKWSLKVLKAKAEKAWAALRKEGSAWEKAKGVWGALFEKIDVIETEEEKKNKQTAIEAGSVLVNLDEGNAIEALVPALSVTDEKGVVQTPPEVVKDIVGVTYGTAKLLDKERSDDGKAKSGETIGILSVIADKADEKKNPDGKSLNDEEKKVFLGYGARLAMELKKRYPDKDDFKEALDDFDESTENAPVGFHSLKTDTFASLFKGGDMQDVLEPILDRLSRWQKIKLFKDYKIGKLESGLATGQIPDSLNECVANILPNTDKSARDNVLKTIGQIFAQKKLGVSFPTNQQLTDLIFDIDDDDFLELSNDLA